MHIALLRQVQGELYMLASLIIALREGLEASLIVGIVFGFLRKTGQSSQARYAWYGVITAVLVSVAVALGIQAVGAELEGQAEQIFEGTMMLIAVGLLTWMIFWMRYHSRTLKSNLESELQTAMTSGNPRALFAVTFFAVVREGIETALFISAVALTAADGGTLLGTLLGLMASVIIGYAIYASTTRLNLSQFFNVTSFLLLLFAAGLLAHGIHEFQEAGLLFTLNEHLWNTGNLIAEDSTVGQLLRALFGYHASPSLEEVVVYWGYWLAILLVVPRLVDRRIAQAQSVAKPVTT